MQLISLYFGNILPKKLTVKGAKIQEFRISRSSVTAQDRYRS